jgi:hypothetical protein
MALLVMESNRMTRARALVAAVPQRVWTAVSGLVLLASLGVALVLGAGLSTWQGGVSHGPAQQGGARLPQTVLTPPHGAVVVVPTPLAPRPPVSSSRSGNPGQGPAETIDVTQPPVGATPAESLPPAAEPPATPGTEPTTAEPRTVDGGTGSLPRTSPGRAKHGKPAKQHPAHAAASGRCNETPAAHGRGHANAQAAAASSNGRGHAYGRAHRHPARGC